MSAAAPPTTPVDPALGAPGLRLRWRPWRTRWDAWWTRRHARCDSLRLDQRNVYILPTGAGLLFAAVLLVLLLVSINYQLSLGYLLTFTLAGSTAVSLQATHATLTGLEARLVLGPPRPADQTAPLTVQLRDTPTASGGLPARLARRLGRAAPTGRARHSVTVRLRDAHADSGVATRVAAGGQSKVTLALVPGQRGWHDVPTLCLETRFPFGLFRAWSYWRPASRVLAWPVAEVGAPALPAGRGGSVHSARPARTVEPDAGGVRPWRRGDALRQIHWRRSAPAMAQGGDPVSRDSVEAATPELHLDWRDAILPDPEDRLRRLTAWVQAAEQAGLRYALHLPGDVRETAPDRGDVHLGQCLTRLATWGQPSPGVEG